MSPLTTGAVMMSLCDVFSYGLSWNNNSKGYLLSASDDHVSFDHVEYNKFNCYIVFTRQYVCGISMPLQRCVRIMLV